VVFSPAVRWAALALRVAVSTALLYWVLSSVDLGNLAGRMLGSDPMPLAGALALYFIGVILIGALRWRVLLASQGVAAPFRFLLSSYLVATFFNNLLPTNIGGDVFRIKDAARYTASKTLSTAVIFVDRLLGFAALFALALLALVFGGQLAGSLPGLTGLWIGLPLVTLTVLTVLVVPEVVAFLLAPVRRLGSAWASQRVGVVTDALFRFREQFPALAKAFAVSVLIQGSIVLFHFLVASAMRIPLPLTYCFLIVPLCLLAQLFPSINGFGIRESVFVFFFRPLGLGAEQAVSLSFMATGMVVLLSLSGGAIYAGRKA
jgi:uncharacterized membrane protein YbhN (UPF0104 family)